MGRTSKFSFPIPGRKHAATKESERAQVQSPAVVQSGLSKAQRILGTDGDLNIDSPMRHEDLSWRYPSSRSSDMSISISESSQSTQSTNETGSFQASSLEKVDHGSGIGPKSRLRGKASSTLLGKKYGDDMEADDSSTNRRMRHEDSCSTLKLYYDRQKSPLSISQQTSASSARDLALRKGMPPVLDLATSPSLLQMVSSSDAFEANFVETIRNGGNQSRDKTAKKKPPKLDFSSMFPSLSKRSNKLNLTPTSTNEPQTPDSLRPNSGLRKLTKSQSRESLRRQQHSARPTSSRLHLETTDSLSNMYDSYEQLVLAPHLSQIPESTVTDKKPQLLNDEELIDSKRKNRPARALKPPEIPPRSTSDRLGHDFQASMQGRRRIDFNSQSQQSPSNDSAASETQPFSWTHVRESMIKPPWDSSAASVSSKNTKTSRHTSASVMSNSDLKQSSVLSLSSDSEDEDDEDQTQRMSPTEPSNEKSIRVMSGGTQLPMKDRQQHSRQPEQLTSRRPSTRKGAAHVSPFLSIPETDVTSSRLSGPWAAPKVDDLQPATGSLNQERKSNRTPSTSSASSKRSSNQPTPPVSPNQAPLRHVPDSSRFMALTEQEAALVAALRTKKAKMRERIIREHETAKAPPVGPERKPSKQSKRASSSSNRESGSREEKHKILLYLDTPLHEGHTINTAEPSPDFSDFLSDEGDPIPSTSYVQPKKGKPRPDSIAVSPTDPVSQKDTLLPSVVRLSAVGASGGLRKDRSSQGSKRSTSSGLRLSDSSKGSHRKDSVPEENEERETGWGTKSSRNCVEAL